MQNSLFFGETPATLAKPARSTPVTQPPSRIDRKAEYEALQQDLAVLADGWEDLHLWVLQRHLRLLADPMTGPAERAELWEWVQAPQVFQPSPFSFQACLGLYDPRLDPEDIQGHLRHRCRTRISRPPAASL